jgi:Lon protease-like protein
MTEKLALFPLSLVAYPGEPLNLHIFEPRYKQLIKDCDETGMHFGIPVFVENKGMTYGTEMKLEKIEHIHPDGKIDISTTGLRIFALKDYSKTMDGKLYPGGVVEYKTINYETDLNLLRSVTELLKKLYKVMKLEYKYSDDPSKLNAYKLSVKAGLSLEQELDLLKLAYETDRLTFLKNHLLAFLPAVMRMEELREKVKMNGHFKNIISPDV